MSEAPSWREFATRVDGGGDDVHIFDREFRCDVDGCDRTDPIQGEGPTSQHIQNKHPEVLRPGPRGQDDPSSSDDEDDVDASSSSSSTSSSSRLDEAQPSRWAPPQLDDRPDPRRDPPGDDPDDDVDEDLDEHDRRDRGEQPRQPVPDPEEFVPVAQTFREHLDRGLIARGCDPEDLPPEAFRESIDLEGAKVLAKYMPTHGAEINLAFFLLVGYGPVIWQMRQDKGLDQDTATDQGIPEPDAQRAQEPEGDIDPATKQAFLEEMAA